MSTSPKFFNKKTVTVAIFAVGLLSAVLVAAVMVPRPLTAFGSRPFGMYGGHPSTFGSGPYGYGMWDNKGTSNANWTGSVPLESVRADVIEVIKDKVGVSGSDAESAAKQSLGDGSEVCCVTLAPVNGYLVYVVHGIDSSNRPYRIIIDVGDGKVLDSAQVVIGPYAGMGMSGPFGPWKAHGFGGGMWR